MHYLTVQGHTLSLKNNLEKEIYALIKDNDRFIIADNKMDEFKKEIVAKIEELNKKNPRCKPIKASWWTDTFTKDIHLSGMGPINFSLYKSKN